MSKNVLYTALALMLGLGIILFATPTVKADPVIPAVQLVKPVDVHWGINLNLSPYPYGYYDYGYPYYRNSYPYSYYRPYYYNRYYAPIYPYGYYRYHRDFDRDDFRHHRDFDRHYRHHRH